MSRFKPFTLFLCLAALVFILYGHLLMQNWVEYRLAEEEPLEQGWEGVITLWDFPKPYSEGGSGFAWLRRRIREFESSHPGTFIELHCLDNQSGQVQLELAVQTGRYPDIAPLQGNLWYADRGILEPLDEYFTEERRQEFFDYAVRAVTYNDKIWGFPLYGTATVLLLNLDLFKERAIDPPKDGRWTYYQFVERLERLTWDRDGDGEKDVYGFNAPIFNGHYSTWGIIFSDGWNMWDPFSRRYTVCTPEAISGLKKLADLSLKYKVVPEDFGISSPEEAWNSFAVERRVAVYPAELSAIAELEKLDNTGEGFEWGIAEYPIGERGSPVTVGSGVEAYCIFKQQDRGKMQRCLEFLEFIAQDYRGEKAAGRGLLPVCGGKDANYNFAVNPEHIITIPKRDGWSYVEDIVNNHLRQAVLGEESPEEALKAAQEEINTIKGSR